MKKKIEAAVVVRGTETIAITIALILNIKKNYSLILVHIGIERILLSTITTLDNRL